MGAIPHKTVTSRFSSNRGKQNFRGSKGRFFDQTTGEEGVDPRSQ